MTRGAAAATAPSPADSSPSSSSSALEAIPSRVSSHRGLLLWAPRALTNRSASRQMRRGGEERGRVFTSDRRRKAFDMRGKRSQRRRRRRWRRQKGKPHPSPRAVSTSARRRRPPRPPHHPRAAGCRREPTAPLEATFSSVESWGLSRFHRCLQPLNRITRR